MVVVACLRGVFFVSSLVTACSLGPFSLRKHFFYASRSFCPNGGKQRCGCSQMRHKLVRAVRLMAFVTTAIEERAGFVLLIARVTNDGGDWLGEETGDGGAWGKKLTHTAAVNEDFDVPTHSERSPSLRRGIVGTNVRVSLRVKHCESAVRRTSKQERCVKTLVKYNNHTLDRTRRKKKNRHLHHRCFLCSGRRACKNFDERCQSGNTSSDGTGRFRFQTAQKP